MRNESEENPKLTTHVYIDSLIGKLNGSRLSIPLSGSRWAKMEKRGREGGSGIGGPSGMYNKLRGWGSVCSE